MSSGPHDPADEPADERLLLLSAYVDDEATPAERARVENDPELLAEAQRLLTLKAGIAAVDPLSAEARSQLLGVAIAEFERLPQSAAPPSATPPPPPGAPPPPPPTPMVPTPSRPPRRSRPTWLAQAAAVIAVLAVGGAAFAVWQSDDDSDDSGADMAVESTEQESGDSDLGSASADGQGGAPADEEAGEGSDAADEDSAGAPPAVDDAEDESAEAYDVEETDDTNSDDATADAPDREGETEKTTMSAAEPGASARQQLADEDDLAEWYEDVTSGRINPPSGGERQCDQRILGEALYDDTSVFIAIDAENVNAHDAENCRIIATTPVP